MHRGGRCAAFCALRSPFSVSQPALGRFLQRDTFAGHLLRPQSLHTYTYAENNPATFTDPTGHQVWRGEQCPPGWYRLPEGDCVPPLEFPPPNNPAQPGARPAPPWWQQLGDPLGNNEFRRKPVPPDIILGQVGGTGGVISEIGKLAVAVCLLGALSTALIPTLPPGDGGESSRKHYVHVDGIIRVGFDPQNAHKAVKLGYEENLRTPVPDGYSIQTGWFWSGLASQEDQQLGWWSELLDAMANTSSINFVVDGMDIFNNPNRLKADKITHDEMDEVIRRGYVGKLHLWENRREITGSVRARWIAAWIKLRGLE